MSQRKYAVPVVSRCCFILTFEILICLPLCEEIPLAMRVASCASCSFRWVGRRPIEARRGERLREEARFAVARGMRFRLSSPRASEPASQRAEMAREGARVSNIGGENGLGDGEHRPLSASSRKGLNSLGPHSERLLGPVLRHIIGFIHLSRQGFRLLLIRLHFYFSCAKDGP